MESPSKTSEVTGTQEEAPLYTQPRPTEEPPIPGVATTLPVRIKYSRFRKRLPLKTLTACFSARTRNHTSSNLDLVLTTLGSQYMLDYH
jgi:hypothetical protein